jgi:hypothetical protein
VRVCVAGVQQFPGGQFRFQRPTDEVRRWASRASASLRRLKSIYGPDNVFRSNQNIPPA